MKRTPLIVFVLVVAVAAAVLSLGGCSQSGGLEKAVKTALLAADTTQTRYDSICQMIVANPSKYKDYIGPDGKVNHTALAALIERVGADIRPPMHWNTAAYGAREMSLTIYFERSGSMTPYDATSGLGRLKKSVNDIINGFPGKEVDIKIVNDNIYPYGGSVDDFLRDRNIYASTQGIGNSSYTDFERIFSKILEGQQPDNISVVVTDMIYSPAGTEKVYIEKILNEENALATRIFHNHPDKAAIVHRFVGDYNGKYYPYTNRPVDYKGQRPYFMIVVADRALIDAMQGSEAYAALAHPETATHTYRFNQPAAEVDYTFVPGWKDDAGRYRISHKKPGTLTGCKPDGDSKKFCFSFAANLAPLHLSDAYVGDVGNYIFKSDGDFTLTVTPITADMITPNNKQYLEGKTHLFTIGGTLSPARDAVSVALRHDFPAWVAELSTNDDLNTSSADFAKTTFGLRYWLEGMNAAFNVGNVYTEIKLTLER